MICNLTVSLLGHGRVLQICVSVICDPSTLHSRPPFCGAGLLHKRLLLWSWSIFPHVTGQGLHRLQLPHEPSITRKIIGLIIPAHKQSLVIFFRCIFKTDGTSTSIACSGAVDFHPFAFANRVTRCTILLRTMSSRTITTRATTDPFTTTTIPVFTIYKKYMPKNTISFYFRFFRI